MSDQNGGPQAQAQAQGEDGAPPQLQKPVKRTNSGPPQKQKRQSIQSIQSERQTQAPQPLQRQQRQQQSKEQQQNSSLLQPQPAQRRPQRSPTPQQQLQRQHTLQLKKKKGCCSCCGKSSPDVTDTDVEDDATHIASLNKYHTQTDKKKSSCSSCFSCCRKRKRKRNGGLSDREHVTTTKTATKRSTCKKCCKKFLAFVFSHVGLCSLVVAYSIFGGFLFQWLESTDEIIERISVTSKRNASVLKLWNMTKELNVLYERNWTALADQVLREFQAELFASIKERGWDGRDEANEEMQWSFSGSLLYSVTVITTIGYGHIAPKTDMGRLVTMFYALIGIPLTLLCLSNIGSFFANCFRFLYKHLCNGMIWLCCPTPQRRPRNHGSISTMTTSASMRSVSSKKSKSINTEYEESRQALRQDSNDISMVEKGLRPGNGSRDGKAGNRHSPREEHEVMINVEEVPIKKIPLKEEIRVPMVVSLVIIAGYIFGGAVLFSLWEKDWNYLIGSYFCFITLSTIGFGDYVFGVGSDLANSEKMIICALYLVMGLSIIAMCFNLMQEEVRAKSRWLGAKLGIIEPRNRGRRKK